MLDPNPAIPDGPANAPPPSTEPTDEEETDPEPEPDPEPDSSGQNIDGNQNTQISGDGNIIQYMGDGDGEDEGDKTGTASTLDILSQSMLAALILLLGWFNL